MKSTVSEKGTVVPIPKNPVKAGYGILKGRKSLVKALLQERANERTHEERKFSRRSDR